MALFEKFKLVPFKEDSKNKPESEKNDASKLTKYLRNYNPVLRSMVNSYAGMRDAVHGRKHSLTAKDRLNLLNTNRARLLHLRRADVGSSQPVENDDLPKPISVTGHLKDEQKDAIEATHKTEGKSYTAASPTTKLPVPKQYKGKFTALMKAAPGALEAGRFGELVIQNKVVPSTSFNEVVKALFVDSKKPLPRGVIEAISELKRVGVSHSLLSAKRAKALLSESSQSGSGHRRRMLKHRKVLRMY